MKIFKRIQEIWSGQKVLQTDRRMDGQTNVVQGHSYIIPYWLHGGELKINYFIWVIIQVVGRDYRINFLCFECEFEFVLNCSHNLRLILGFFSF